MLLLSHIILHLQVSNCGFEGSSHNFLTGYVTQMLDMGLVEVVDMILPTPCWIDFWHKYWL